jgi:hypothetical protein
MARETFKVEWDAHVYEHKERSSDWFWAVGIIIASLAIVAIVFGNIIFGILIIVSAFALSLFINRPPEIIHMVIDENGVTRANIRYPYDTLHSFWVDEIHPHKKILLRSKKMFMPLIIVPLGNDANPEKLQELLLKKLPEQYYSLPFVEKILEYLGF